MTETNTPRNQALAASLREVADLLEAHPDLESPISIDPQWDGRLELRWHVYSPDAMSAIRKAIGGKWEKKVVGDHFALTHEAEALSFWVQSKRKTVCTLRVIGTETVTVPAVEAQPERIEERDIVQWDCAPVLAEAAAS